MEVTGAKILPEGWLKAADKSSGCVVMFDGVGVVGSMDSHSSIFKSIPTPFIGDKVSTYGSAPWYGYEHRTTYPD